MMPRPHVLRHAGDDAQEKPECAIEPLGAKQAAMAAFVHQRKNAQSKQADWQHRSGAEPIGNVDTQHSGPPKERKGRQRRHNLRQSPNIIRLGIPTNDGPFLFLYAADRRHDRAPRFRAIIFGEPQRRSLVFAPRAYKAMRLVSFPERRNTPSDHQHPEGRPGGRAFSQVRASA
jgi:hypothetical protein